MSLLLRAAQRPNAPVYVVLTMRSDFLGDCAHFPGLAEALSESQYLIPRLSREQRRQAIEEPARLFVGGDPPMTPQLVQRLLNDSGTEDDQQGEASNKWRDGTPDPLPVLQHALMRTYLEWKKKGEGPIDLVHYRSAGEMEQALDRHAETVFTKELTDAGRVWAERIFRCLTTTELGRPVRRPTKRTDLYAVIGAAEDKRPEVDEAIEILSRRENSFLQVNSKDTSVDISHESLIWKWKRLRGWVEAEAESAGLYLDLVKGVADKSGPWYEPKLSRVEEIRARDGWNESWGLQYDATPFERVERLLAESRSAVSTLKWTRRLLACAAVAVAILGVVAYFMMQENAKKSKDLAALTEVREKEREASKKQQSELALQADAARKAAEQQGLSEEQKALFAKKATEAEAALKKEREDQQAREKTAQLQSNDLAATVKSQQSRIETLQRERDAAHKERDAEIAKRSDAEKKAAAEIARIQRELEAAKKPAAVVDPAPPVTKPAAAPITVREKPSGERWVNPVDGLTYVRIVPKPFEMGCSPKDKDCFDNEEPRHTVTISNIYYLGHTEVTQAAWTRVMKVNPSSHKGDDLPVENVTWSDASNYCKAINGRLPTEAEWEFAARGGTTGPTYGRLDDIAWYDKNSKSQTHPVGQKNANAFGLHDMLGNVWEWVADWYGPYGKEAVSDPKGPSTGTSRSLRGGSWDDNPRDARVSGRNWVEPADRSIYIGFRCAGE